MNLPQLQNKSTAYNLVALMAASLFLFFILISGLFTAFFSKIKNLTNKKIIIFILLFIFIESFTGCINNEVGYIQMVKYTYPPDEGRHEGINESWWLGCYVTSNSGDEFFICGLYVIRSNGDLIQAISVNDINNGFLFSKMNNYESGFFSYNLSKLDLQIGPTEHWFQINTSSFTYKFITEISDELSDVSLDLIIESKKGPTIQDTLGAISDKLNKTAYYDHTRCDVTGELIIFNKKIMVHGTGYISREWGDVLGGSWQWSAIQLENNYEICAAKFQNINGINEAGWLVNPDGNVKEISDLEIKITEYSHEWWSEKWFLKSDDEGFNLTVELMSDLNKVINLNEGICSVEGLWRNNKIEGICFSEQTTRFPNN